jgi:Arm DNA-binding domain
VIRYQTISKFSIESGYTEWAIRGKIRDGVWLEGRVWVRAPDGSYLDFHRGIQPMGRSRSGVRAISGSSIEITFAYRGVRCRERVRLKPTPANLKRAARHRAAVLDAIERNTFDYATTFPDSARRLLFLDRPGEAMGSLHISMAG